MGAARKVTIQLPTELLDRAQQSSGKNLTATICQGLRLVAAGPAYEGLRRLKGKVRFSIDLPSLREDRGAFVG